MSFTIEVQINNNILFLPNKKWQLGDCFIGKLKISRASLLMKLSALLNATDNAETLLNLLKKAHCINAVFGWGKTTFLSDTMDDHSLVVSLLRSPVEELKNILE